MVSAATLMSGHESFTVSHVNASYVAFVGSAAEVATSCLRCFFPCEASREAKYGDPTRGVAISRVRASRDLLIKTVLDLPSSTRFNQTKYIWLLDSAPKPLLPRGAPPGGTASFPFCSERQPSTREPPLRASRGNLLFILIVEKRRERRMVGLQ
jgi:hypothetical protein